MRDSDHCEIKDLQHTLFCHAFRLHDEGWLSPPDFCSEFFLCRDIISFLSVTSHYSLRALRNLLYGFSRNSFLKLQGQVMMCSITVYMQRSMFPRHLPPCMMIIHFIRQCLAIYNLRKQKKASSFLCATSSHTPICTFVHRRYLTTICGMN